MGLSQAFPHMPQFSSSVIRSTQVRLQQVCPAGQDGSHWQELSAGSTQFPAQQTCPEEHAWLQVPQLEESVWRFRQVPLQQVSIGGMDEHFTPQAPQLK